MWMSVLVLLLVNLEKRILKRLRSNIVEVCYDFIIIMRQKHSDSIQSVFDGVLVPKSFYVIQVIFIVLYNELDFV